MVSHATVEFRTTLAGRAMLGLYAARPNTSHPQLKSREMKKTYPVFRSQLRIGLTPAIVPAGWQTGVRPVSRLPFRCKPVPQPRMQASAQ
jgi:hypothetical protein